MRCEVNIPVAAYNINGILKRELRQIRARTGRAISWDSGKHARNAVGNFPDDAIAGVRHVEIACRIHRHTRGQRQRNPGRALACHRRDHVRLRKEYARDKEHRYKQTKAAADDPAYTPWHSWQSYNLRQCFPGFGFPLHGLLFLRTPRSDNDCWHGAHDVPLRIAVS